jgi:hypothetical protein
MRSGLLSWACVLMLALVIVGCGGGGGGVREGMTEAEVEDILGRLPRRVNSKRTGREEWKRIEFLDKDNKRTIAVELDNRRVSRIEYIPQ